MTTLSERKAAIMALLDHKNLITIQDAKAVMKQPCGRRFVNQLLASMVKEGQLKRLPNLNDLRSSFYTVPDRYHTIMAELQGVA